MYEIRDREAENKITTCESYEEAVTIVADYEKQDIADGSFVPSSYKIIEVNENEY